MKETVNFSRFCDAFQIRKDSFSYEGKKALFEYLEDYEDGTGEEIELDVIALCCDYTEYEDIKEYNNDYGEDCKTIEEIEEKTQVIKVNEEGFIIQQY